VFGPNGFRSSDEVGVPVRGSACRSIDHVGVAVADLEAAIALHRDTYGMPLVYRETNVEQGVEAVLFDVGDGHVELLAPLADDTPVGRFLARRGPGLHHVAYRVDDVAATLDELRAAGVRVIDEQPRAGIRGSRVAFLHPEACGGVLTELVQPAEGRSPVTGAVDGAGRHQSAGRAYTS